MEYVTFERFGDQDPGDGDDVYTSPDTDALLLDQDNAGQLNHPSLGPRIFVGKLVKRQSVSVISLVVLCMFLAAGLLVVSFEYYAKYSKKEGDDTLIKREQIQVKHFIQISDTHLDIYYDSNVTSKNYQGCRNKKHRGNYSEIQSSQTATTAVFGRLGCDSPSLLLESLKVQLQTVYQSLEDGVEFILLTGDQVGHGYEFFDVDVLQSVLWSIGNSTQFISDALPDIPMFMAMGNNDLKLDYLPPIANHSNFYQSIYPVFESAAFPKGAGIEKLNSKVEFKRTFEYGGFYSIVLQGGSMLLIVVNTNYWSRKAFIRSRNVTIIGDFQMNWLHSQLSSASSKKQKVIIAGHIPPSIDSYDGKSGWTSNYTNAYTFMTTQSFKEILIAQLYGHIHQDKIKLQYLGDKYHDGEDKAFLLTCPSITPIYKSNPAYRVYDFSTSGTVSLKDYTQYYLDLPVSNVNKKGYWAKEYSFREAYGVELNKEGLEQIVNNFLNSSSSDWDKYMLHMKTKMGGTFSHRRYIEFCASKHFSLHAYTNCTAAYKDVGI